MLFLLEKLFEIFKTFWEFEEISSSTETLTETSSWVDVCPYLFPILINFSICILIYFLKKRMVDEIVKDRVCMSEMISEIQNCQTDFVSCLHDVVNTKLKILEENIRVSLEEVSEGNEQRYQKMNLQMVRMQEDLEAMKPNSNKKIASEDRNDINKNIEQKLENGDSCNTSKIMEAFNSAFADIMKDVKLDLSSDQVEENRELKNFLVHVAETESIILKGFENLAEQAKKNYDQVDQFGEVTLKSIAILKNNTSELIRMKFDETNEVLKSVMTVVNQQKYDVDAVQRVVGNMTGEFADLFEKLVDIRQVSMEQCGEMMLNFKRTSNEWEQNVSKIEKMTKQISDDSKLVKQLFQEIKDLAQSPQKTDIVKDMKKVKTVVEQNDAEGTMIKAEKQSLLKQENLSFVFSYWARMRSVSCKVENNCHSICEIICGLEPKLRSLNESVEKLDKFIHGLNLNMLPERDTSMNYKNNITTIVDDIMQTSQCNASDGHSSVIASSLGSTSKNLKLNNAMKVDCAVKFTDSLLKKVCGEKYQNNEKSTRPKPNENFITAEESPDSLRDGEEQPSRNSAGPQDHKAKAKKAHQSQ